MNGPTTRITGLSLNLLRHPTPVEPTEEEREILRFVARANIALRAIANQESVPVFCEWLMCLAVEPEFQDDRLADYQERFNDLWVPKFGQRAAVVVYVWHVLRQSRLIDWLVRTFR